MTDNVKRYVNKVLKDIAELHPHKEKQAKPIQLDNLTFIVNALEKVTQEGSLSYYRQAARDKALLLIGFWRAFRSDELANLNVEHIKVSANEGMEIFVPCSKGDHSELGRRYKAPALQRLYPMRAYLEWLNIAQIENGPVFRSINRWGHIGEKALNLS